MREMDAPSGCQHHISLFFNIFLLLVCFIHFNSHLIILFFFFLYGCCCCWISSKMDGIKAASGVVQQQADWELSE
jgi:hypothetical protein